MLFVWNAAFIVGFLPLVGWNAESRTFRFFSFFPWHFLLFNALVVLLCAVVCVGCMITLRRRGIHETVATRTVAAMTTTATAPVVTANAATTTLEVTTATTTATNVEETMNTTTPSASTPTTPKPGSMGDVFANMGMFGKHTRSLEVRKYRHLHQTILMESCMWITAYSPFFLYIAVACRQCIAGHFQYSDASIIYFIPIFLVKSLFSAFLQAFRTIHVHAIMNKLITEISHGHHHHRHQHHHQHNHHHPHPNYQADNIVGHYHDYRHNNYHRHHHNHHRHKGIQRSRSRDKPKKAGVATISYTNPLCEHHQQLELEERKNVMFSPTEEKRDKKISRHYSENNFLFDVSSSSDESGYQNPFEYQPNMDNDGVHISPFYASHPNVQHGIRKGSNENALADRTNRQQWLSSEKLLKQQQRPRQDTEITEMTSFSGEQFDQNQPISRQASNCTSTMTGFTNLGYRPTMEYECEKSTKL